MQVDGLNWPTAFAYLERGYPIRQESQTDSMYVRESGVDFKVSTGARDLVTVDDFGMEQYLAKDWTLRGLPTGAEGEEKAAEFHFCGRPLALQPDMVVDDWLFGASGALFDLTNPPCMGVGIRRVSRGEYPDDVSFPVPDAGDWVSAGGGVYALVIGIFEAAVNLSADRAVAIRASDGKAILADSSSGTAIPAVGVVKNAVSSGQTVTVYGGGAVAMAGSYTAEQVYYLGAAGAITTSVPGSGIFQRIGQGLGGDLLVQIGEAETI